MVFGRREGATSALSGSDSRGDLEEFGRRKDLPSRGSDGSLADIMRATQRDLHAHPKEAQRLGGQALTLDHDLTIARGAERECALTAR